MHKTEVILTLPLAGCYGTEQADAYCGVTDGH